MVSCALLYAWVHWNARMALGLYCGFCPGCGMGIDMPLLKLYFLLRLRFPVAT